MRRESREVFGSGQQQTRAAHAQPLALMGRSPNFFGPRQTREVFSEEGLNAHSGPGG
jgi:hypothetical protein